MEGSSTSSVTTPARSQGGSFTLPKQLEDISPASQFPKVHHRWNTNEEIASILIAFEKHKEWQERELKTRPPSGSMLLYSRNEVRYRKDGYCWKKRRDGKTPREDHMKLKVQGLECINGSYVHSAILPTFHRRCYWLLQNPDIVLVHYLNVPYPDNTKLSIPVVSYAMEKKEWTKEELVDQLRPMFTAGSQNEGCKQMIEETVEAIVQQLIDFQDKRKTKPHVCDATCDKNCLHSNCFKISPRGEISALPCQSPTTSAHNRLVSFLQRNNQRTSTQTTVPQDRKRQGVGLSSASTEAVNAANIAQQPFILSLGNIPNNGLILVSGQTTTPVSILSSGTVTNLQPSNVINSQVTSLQQSHVSSSIGTAVSTQISQQPDQILAAPSACHIATQITAPTAPQHYTQIQTSSKASTPSEKKELCSLLVDVNNQILSLQMSSEGNLEIVNVKTDKNEQSTNPTPLTNMNIKLEADTLGSNTDTIDSFQGSMTSLTGSDLNLDHLDLLDLPDLEKLCGDVDVIGGDSNNLISCDTAGNRTLLGCANSTHSQMRTTKGPTSTIVPPPSQTINSQDEQLKVTITDFSPDWSYTEGGTKVLIVGPWYSNCSSYSCLFDGKRVPATFVQSGVLRCFTPAHDLGLVSLQIISDGYVISNSVVFEFKDRERLDSQLGQQDWFSLDENQLRILLVERIEQLEKQINSVCGNTSSLKQIPVCEFEDKVETYMKIVISQLWSNADTFPKTGTLGLTLLHLAAGLGYSKLIHTLIQQRSDNSNWLLEYEVDAHSVDQNSCTPLMWACAKGKRMAAVALYHWNKGSLKVCNKEGFLPLYIARKKGYHGLANDIDQLEQSEMDTSVFDSTHSFVHANSSAIFSVSPSKSSNIPITSTPISKDCVFQTPQLVNTSKPILGNLHIDIPPPPSYPSSSRLVRRRSDQMIQETGTRGQLNKRFSVDVLPRSGSDSPQFSPGRPYQKPVREANSEPRLSVSVHTHSVTGDENPMFSGRDLHDMDIQTESFLESYKLSSDNIVPIEPYPASQDPNSMLMQMDTDEISSVRSDRSDSPFIDVEKLSPNENILEHGKCKKGGDCQSAGSEGSEEAKHQMVTLAKQIIAAMPERIKSTPSKSDDLAADELVRERSSSHGSLQSQLSPHASSYGEDSGISTPMGDSWAFDEYRYTDIGTPTSSMSPDSTCLTSPYSPYNFQLDSPPPTTADFTEYFNAPATFMEKDFSQLTLSDQEQRRLYEAAKVIQHAYRHYRDKQQLQQQKEIEAAILIQSYYRRYKQYAYYKKMTQAAVLIQSQFRSYYAQKRFKKSRDAAVVIQNQYRSYREHERLKKSGNKSVIIQQRFRSHYQRKSADSAEGGPVVQLVSETGEGATVDSNSTEAGSTKAPDAESNTLSPNQENVVKGEATEDHESSIKSVKE